MKISIFSLCLIALLLTSPCLAAEKSTSELRLIAQAGGSLIVDLSKHGYSASELIAIASSLSHGTSLTIRMRQDGSELSIAQCAQIARAKPGQVRFWF
ncbi:hypothetical protein [uncultured Desulfovibrio sp.]|mgnify:CR=1 FL=1|uniref:hypothetical protein n=1 Tax=uncultured Desulfovibrio sp. TaxID=167968 RepID=UPI002672753B|nr:hypothetical protein [uncultured Desulfovibrio sp.]